MIHAGRTQNGANTVQGRVWFQVELTFTGVRRNLNLFGSVWHPAACTSPVGGTPSFKVPAALQRIVAFGSRLGECLAEHDATLDVVQDQSMMINGLVVRMILGCSWLTLCCDLTLTIFHRFAHHGPSCRSHHAASGPVRPLSPASDPRADRGPSVRRFHRGPRADLHEERRAEDDDGRSGAEVSPLRTRGRRGGGGTLPLRRST